MNIYSEIVIDMQNLAVLSSLSYAYYGDMALCGGGGSKSETNTVDYAYNARMAALSEEQNTWAREYFGMWQEHFKPYEIAQAKSNLEMLPLETELYKNQLKAAQELLPGQLKASQDFLNAPQIDVNERMTLASADTASAWKGADDASLRENARLGVNPNSGRFQGIQAAMDTQKSAQLAGARTQARVGAEQENFERLGQKASFNASGQMLQGLNFIKG